MKTFFPNHWLMAATLMAAPLSMGAQQCGPQSSAAPTTSKHEMKEQQKQAKRDEKAADAQSHAAKQQAKAQKEADKAKIDSEKAANKASDAAK